MSNSQLFPNVRMRRLRQSEKIRSLIRETNLSPNELIMPLFVRHGRDEKRPIASMPGQFQLSVDKLEAEVKAITQLGLPAVLLFGIPEHKDGAGYDSYADDGVIQNAIKEIKEVNPDLLVIADTCFCEYTDHGHCGFIKDVNGNPDVDNDKTLELIAKQAIAQAKAGADIVAPSGNMDGMVGAIRQRLDQEGFTNTIIQSYAVKYASSFYGPFRDAAEGAPKFGDRKTYQMDPSNANEALREVELDIAEGADMIMVKPALAYLDIIQRIKTTFPYMPLSAYQVSGEYAMIKAAAENGWLDEKKVTLESLTSIKRAGANFIFSYFAKDVAGWLQE